MSNPEPIAWTSWPVRDEPPRKTLLLVSLMALTSLVAALMAMFAGLLAAAMLFILMGPYFLPTSYEVSQRGVEKRFPLFNRSRTWDIYKRYMPMKDGVFLGTFPVPSRLDSFRGDFIRFNGRVDRERVLELVRLGIGSGPEQDKRGPG
jgi:hypothetical protein